MTPEKTGNNYDKIASWWQSYHLNSQYGVEQVERAIGFSHQGASVLDVGCGAGGRIIALFDAQNMQVTGIDVSYKMVTLAQQQHPEHHFIHGDIHSWKSSKKFDLIVAWDSLFHLPLLQQKPVLEKLCKMLNKDGVLMYTFGDDHGEHTNLWRGETFYYSAIGIKNNLELLLSNNMNILHLELDQYPEKHTYVIAKRA